VDDAQRPPLGTRPQAPASLEAGEAQVTP